MKKLNQWIDRFAYSHPRFGIPNLMLYIVIANAVTYALTVFAGSSALSFLEFDLYHLLHGEVWRLVTFVLLPFSYRPLSLFIMLSFYYFVGGTLEREWGTAKFTLYYLSGMILSVLSTVILSLATGYYGWSLSDAYYINLTLFLAFAALYPDAQIMFYMVIPLKAKWLAWADVALFGWNIIRSLSYGAYASALAAVVAILNFDLLLGGHQKPAGYPEPPTLPADHPVQVRRPAAEASGGGAGLPPQVRGLRPHGRRPPGAGVPLLLQVSGLSLLLLRPHFQSPAL